MASIGDFFKKAAPYLSMGLNLIPGGGPAVQILSGVVSKVVGKQVEPESIAQTVSDLATSEQGRIQLQQIEDSYAQAMQQMKFDNAEKMLELQNADRSSARQREVSLKDKFVPLLAGFVIVSFTAAVLSVLFGWGKVEAAFAGTLIGYLSANTTQVVSYYFGSSAAHDELTAGKG